MSYNHKRKLQMAEQLSERFGSTFQSAACESFPRRVTSVLVPLDGTRAAEHALPTAIAMARRVGARLWLVHVHTPTACVSDPIQLLSFGCREAELMHQRVDYLAQVVQRIEQAQSIPVRASLIRSDQFDTALSGLVQATDIVVMATRQRGWWKSVTGSVVNPLSQQLTCPLLVVPGYRSPVDLTGDPLPAEVVVPLDGSAAAEQIVAKASAMAQLCGARLTLLHVRSLRPSFPPKTPMRYLEQLAMPLRALHPVRTLVLESNGRTAAQAILSYLKVRGGGLLTMASPRARTLKQLWRPGTAHTLMARYPGPLLFQPQERALSKAAGRILPAF